MIKKIIFDLDNTIMDMPDDTYIKFQELIDKFNLNIKAKELYDAIGTYETNGTNTYYDIQKVVETVNNCLNINIDNKFITEFFNMYDKLISKISDEEIETLKYLKSKYEVVILTNWFTESQKNRLMNAGILEYFDNVYGTDIVPMKPKKESFLTVIGDLKPSECVMIGDNLEVDIKIPYELGMNVYHLNKKGTSKYPTIKKIEDLKKLL